jgi:hypothetical protein
VAYGIQKMMSLSMSRTSSLLIEALQKALDTLG